ncbi:MAG: GTP cyclohydrolase II [Enterovibrio sp.]
MVSVRVRVDLHVGARSHIPAQLLSFDGLSSKQEHIAIIFANADQNQAQPLVRLHSECLTGDVFHSSRCDCGEQLNETIELMAKEGGILLYLRQEGRGIGLYNKLDAYKLQSQGMNTYQANNQLGFADDLRTFNDAAQMLKALNVANIRLMTNNPKKINELKELGINIVEVIGTQVYLKNDNAHYLQAKVEHGKHQLKIK